MGQLLLLGMSTFWWKIISLVID